MEQYLYQGVKRKPQSNPDNWQFASLQACKAKTKEKLPSYVNLKDKFPPVYTQTCGSCTANAVCACDAFHNHPDNPEWMPSTVFTYYNSRVYDGDKPTDPDVGSTVETALHVTRKQGVCNSKIWPNTKPYNEKPSKKAYENGLKGKEITTYYNTKTFLQIKKALASGYPVPGAVAWAFKSYDDNFIMNLPTKKEVRDCEYGHAIVFVGYDDDKQLIEFRNSWSEEWGNKGYAYMTYETFERVIWYDDTYAVVK